MNCTHKVGRLIDSVFIFKVYRRKSVEILLDSMIIIKRDIVV